MSYETEMLEAIKDQRAALALPRFKNAMISLIEKEISLLEDWVKRTNYGGWSTHLNDDMNKRITQLKDMHYALVNNRTGS